VCDKIQRHGNERMPSSSSVVKKKNRFNVAVIASSGGGTATLGHTDPTSLLQTNDGQLELADCCISETVLVALDGGKGMDGCDETVDMATLYQVVGNSVINDGKAGVHSKTTNDKTSLLFQCSVTKKGTLKEVNDYVNSRIWMER
jgi:hypothetical protein